VSDPGSTAGIGVYDDAACQVPSVPSIAHRVSHALGDIQAVWPTFPAAFSAIVTGVTADQFGRQARAAVHRPRVAAIDPGWTPKQLAVALVGELGRVAAQLVLRIGCVLPDTGYRYTCCWAGATADIARAAAVAATASYVGWRLIVASRAKIRRPRLPG
jgi:hypothetical protein